MDGIRLIDPTPAPSSGIARTDSDRATATFEAMLLQSAFAPVSAALGFYGDIVVGTVLRSALVDRR